MGAIDGAPDHVKSRHQHDETKNAPSLQLENWQLRNENAEDNMARNDLVEHFKLKAFVENKITRHVHVLSDPDRGIREYEYVTEWKRHGSLGHGRMGAVHLEVQVGNPNKKRAVKVISKQDLKEVRFDPQRELRFLGIASKVWWSNFIYKISRSPSTPSDRCYDCNYSYLITSYYTPSLMSETV